MAHGSPHVQIQSCNVAFGTVVAGIVTTGQCSKYNAPSSRYRESAVEWCHLLSKTGTVRKLSEARELLAWHTGCVTFNENTCQSR